MALLGFLSAQKYRDASEDHYVTRALGSAICASIFAVATVTLAQNASQITPNSNINVAQGTTQPAPTHSKASPKSKVKKAKRDKGTGSPGAKSQQPVPAVGPPDPGKYL